MKNINESCNSLRKNSEFVWKDGEESFFFALHRESKGLQVASCRRRVLQGRSRGQGRRPSGFWPQSKANVLKLAAMLYLRSHAGILESGLLDSSGCIKQQASKTPLPRAARSGSRTAMPKYKLLWQTVNYRGLRHRRKSLLNEKTALTKQCRKLF